MKIKDLERTANVAWSPQRHHPVYLAAGTAAQQLDASFSTSAALEIYALNLTEPGFDLELKNSAPTEHRFHKLVWGAQGAGEDGTIVGGCDKGVIEVYNVSKQLGGENGLVSHPSKHSGAVYALDFNPYQQNLLATGSSDSEIFIWDMNNTSTPMSPGAKTQPPEDVLSVAWNRQVQHILASAFPAKCVVWDLRKNEPIIKLTDTVSRIRWKVVAWHPEVATQLCLASEEDQAPYIQLWDLRFATSPLKTLQDHQRGVLSMAWCKEDPDLLISCGKDNRIVCSNPNSNQPNGEVLSEIAHTNQWTFDVVWCPRNPAIVACPNFDGHVSVYSLMGGKTQQLQTTNKIADSFPGMDGYIQAPVQQQSAGPVSVDLTKPPKWLRRPIGASFGFGGKLITFSNEKSIAQTQPGQPTPIIPRIVNVSQVVIEQELVNRSAELEQALDNGDFIEYCINKANATNDQHKRYIWHFLKANFEQNTRAELLNLLGYRIEDVNDKLRLHIGVEKTNSLADESVSDQSRIDSFDFSGLIQSVEEVKQPVKQFKIQTGDDTEGLITQALLLGNVDAAVELCLKAKRFADAIIIAMTGGPELLAKAQYQYLEQSEGYVSSLISALVSEDWTSVVNNCDVSSWKEALAATLTHASEADLPVLCEQLGARLEKESQYNPKLREEAQLCYIVSGNFERLVESWSANAKTSTKNLQELVELVMFLQKSIERQGRLVEVSGSLAELLSYYSSLLASQGNLVTALNYLGNSQDPKVASLRERLTISIGQKPAFGQFQQQQQQQQQQSRKNSMRQSFSSQQSAFAPFNTGLPGVGGSAHAQPWQQPFGGQNAPAPVPQKAFSPAPVAPPPAQPARPGSVGSAHGGSGLPSRGKYVLDPSVQSNNPYAAPRPQQLPPAAAPAPFQPTQQPFQHTNFQANALTNPLQPPQQQQQPPLPSPQQFNHPTPLVPTFQPTTPSFGGGSGAQPVSAQPSFQNNALGAFSAAGEGLGLPPPPPLEVGQSAMNFLPANTAAGWNDPPALSKSARPQYGGGSGSNIMSAAHAGTRLWKRHSEQQNKQDFSSKDPITHPLYGAAPAQNIPYNNGYGDTNQQPFYGQHPPVEAAPPQILNPAAGFGQQQQQQQQQPLAFNTQPLNPAAYNAPPQQLQQQQQQNVGIIRGVEKPQPVEKAPIPEENAVIQTVFDDLRSKCSCAANNPQLKRKLEDVAKKLETLYDLLRDRKLSANTLSGLHNMVQLVQNGDYPSCLGLHTQMVSGPDFSQIASFMPGLKVLFQCALQLQVYL